MKRSIAPLVALALLGLAPSAQAQLTDLATSPLAQSVSDNVKPNLMFIFDDSGSMAWRFMPDYLNDDRIDRPRCTAGWSGGCSGTTRNGIEGNPPWYAYQFNTLYYNPQITYAPALDYQGNPMTSYTSANSSGWTSVPVDAYTSSSGTINLVSGYPETVYCKNSGDSATDTTNCRRNGIDTTNPFQYDTRAGSGNGFPDNTSGSSNFRWAVTRSGSPYYFNMLPREYCTDETLVTCTLSTTATGSFTVPAPVRFCSSETYANDTAAVSGTDAGGQPKCQDKYAPDVDGAGPKRAYLWPRYGRFERVDITSGTATYGNRPARTDCAARPSCTYAEEMTNFANWQAYYSSRVQLMKSGAGRAFNRIDSRFRVGLITINPMDGDEVSSSKYLKIDTFQGSHRQDWYTKLYGLDTGNSTPLREALSRVGRHYAGITSGINKGMDDDPVQYSCQRNVALLTTDGYWNGDGGQKLGGTGVGNQDNDDTDASPYTRRTQGVYDGARSGASDTLADAAAYYYKTDLRQPSGGGGTKSTGALGTDVTDNNVPSGATPKNNQQHMITYSLGLGVDGLMRYRSDYDVATTGDFKKIKDGANTCSWASGTCDWPVPNNDPAKLDDLWHAAVNGRGKYISARDASSLVSGLTDALIDMQGKQGAAAASATSTPNVSQNDNYVFSSYYQTVEWWGNLVASRINLLTGKLEPVMDPANPTARLEARVLLNAKVGTSTDTRTIYANVGDTLVSFTYDNLDSTAKGHFDNKCSLLAQCVTLDSATRDIVNSGTNVVNYLRGRRANESTAFRARDYVLPDLAGSRPAFAREPRRNYGDAVSPSYASFKTANASRRSMIYIGGNGGMLHAFDASTLQEVWSFVPRAVMPRMYRLADMNYGSSHEYYVDGSPEVGDVFDGTAWRTILVGGYNGGGRGYFALDVTNPNAPTLLWEICADSTLCSKVETNLGRSYGNPVITKRPTDGKWVVLVSSGYNNVSPGDGVGRLFVIDAVTGATLERVSTGVGSTTAPSGLGRISGYATDAARNNTAQYVYGGDLQGNLWRFDMSVSPPAVLRMATLLDGTGKVQPITTRPELGKIDGNRVVFVGTGRLLGTSDLQDPATLSPAGNWSYRSSIYALKDTGTAIGSPRASTAMVQQTITEPTPTTRRTSNNPVDWATKLGWWIDLPYTGASTGERVNLDAELALGSLLVTTNIPASNACTAGGTSWRYVLNYRTGRTIEDAQYDSTTMIAGSTVVQDSTTGALLEVTTPTGGDPDIKKLPTDSTNTTARRISWREVQR